MPRVLPFTGNPTLGCLGDVMFLVSDHLVRTFTDATWSGSVRITEHQRHNYHSLTEFTGIDTDEFTLTIEVGTYFGSNPMSDMVKIWTYERNFTPLSLVIGEKIYGKYRWSIKSHKHKFNHYDRKGNVIGVTMSVSLVEYLNE